MSTMRMRRKQMAAASPSAPQPPPTLKEKYATTIGEATAATFRNKRFFAKNFRGIIRMLFTYKRGYVTVLQPLPPHVSKMALAFDDRFGGNLAKTVKTALLKTDFQPYKAIESIDFEMLKVAQDVVDDNIGDLIDQNDDLRKIMIPTNIVLNTNHHVAYVINQAVMNFYTEYSETFFEGFENFSRVFIDDFTDDFFQEYMDSHRIAVERQTLHEIESEPDFSEDEEKEKDHLGSI